MVSEVSNVNIGGVWISELSQRSGVPIPTIKYYLREHLLHHGESVSATRAHYDDGHVARLRLIRALVDVAAMSLDRVREILHHLDDEAADLHAALGSAHEFLSAEPEPEPSEAAMRLCGQMIADQDWHVSPQSRHLLALAAALDAMAETGIALSAETLSHYARAADDIADAELAGMPTGDRDVSAIYMVTGTVLAEPVLLALRRMAHENLSSRRFGHNRIVTPPADDKS